MKDVTSAEFFFRPAAVEKETEPRVGDSQTARSDREFAAKQLVDARLLVLAAAGCVGVLSYPGESLPERIVQGVAFIGSLASGMVAGVKYHITVDAVADAHNREERDGVDCREVVPRLDSHIAESTLRDQG